MKCKIFCTIIINISLLGQLDVCDKTGNAEQTSLFDASYFGIHRQQSLYMDPMTRMSMQNTLEALVDAGETPLALRGRRIFVAAASSLSENDSLMFENLENGYGVTGQARTMLANRISYWLNITGPSYSCDANWLGGFQVLHHGYQAIRNGLTDSAIVIGANLTMNIYPTYQMKHLNVTSPDGNTRSFDEDANGYGRSDGVSVLFLQRADQARRRYASLVDVDLIFNGSRPGKFVYYDLDSARRFLTNFYQQSKLDPLQISYVESYGAGIKEVDRMELTLLDQVYNNGNRQEPLLIGAVKSILGHSEASAVFASIIKVIIAMETGIIPANKDLNNPLNHPAVNEGRCKLLQENTVWNGEYAAVNAFGLASSFGHAILRKNPIEKQPGALETAKKLPLLHFLSARTEDGVKEIIEKVKNYQVLDLDYMNLINGVFSTHIPGFLFRGYVVKVDEEICKEELTHFSGMSRQVWFAYSGMGSQWLGMGKSLLHLPIFAKAIHRCAAALKPFDVDLIHILTDDTTLLDNILNSFVGIAAIQIGLTDVLFSLGIEPDGIIGHSLGELGCAYADGCLTAEQMILSAYYRGRASQEAELIPGLMAAVGIGATEAAKKVPPTIDIACHNGPDSSTLSGPKSDMQKVVKELQDSGIFARLVNVGGIAYHSRYIRPAAPILLEYLHKLLPSSKERSSKWLSSSVKQKHWHTELAKCASPEYLTNNLLSSVYFEEILKFVPKGAVVIEIAPHGLLQAILRRSLHQETVNIALTKRGHADGLEFLFSAIGKMYLSGIQLNISALYEHFYPMKTIVPRGTPSLAPLVRWANAERWRTGVEEFLDYSNNEESFLLDSHNEWFRDISQHRINNNSIIPATSYLPLVCKIISNAKIVDAVEFTNISVKRHRSLPITDEYIPPVRVMIQKATGLFEVSDRYGIVANGQVIVPDQQQQDLIVKEYENRNRNFGEELYKIDQNDIYRELLLKGLELGENCKTIKEIRIFQKGIEASIVWKNNWSVFSLSMLHCRLFHSSSEGKSFLPGFIQRFAATFESLPKENSILKVFYDLRTDTFWSPIIQIQGSVCTTFKNENTKYFAASTKFVPHHLQNSKDLKTFINVCIQIVQNQLNDKTKINVIFCTDLSNKSIRNVLEEHNSYNNFQIHLFEVDGISLNKIDTLPTPTLVVIESKHLKNIPQLLQHYSSQDIHVLVSSKGNLQFETNLTEVLNHEIFGTHYQLLKQVCERNIEIVNINEKTLSINDFDNVNFAWIQNLEMKLQSNSCKEIYLVSRVIPTNGVNVFVKYIQELQGGYKVRFVFLLDKNIPNFSITEPFYQAIIKQNLSIMIYENGAWGNIYTLTICLTDNDINHQVDDEILLAETISNQVEDVNVQFIGIHTSNFISMENNDSKLAKLGLVDYVGQEKDSNNTVMGICNNSNQVDPILRWSVPNNWLLANAVTIPTAYSLAYYILFELTQIQAGETILIDNAGTDIGQALINIAFKRGVNIFALVNSEKQKATLLDFMRMLREESVFDCTDSTFERHVLTATQGYGVNVLISSASGQRLRAGLRCLNISGRVALLQNKANHNLDTDIIGLNIFIKCTGMYGVHPTVLSNLDEETKRRIHSYVQNGINNEIAPITKNIFKNETLDQIIEHIANNQVIGSAVLQISNSYKNQKHFYCNSLSSYIIISDDNDVESMILTSIWLVTHGARKIILVGDPKPSDKSFLHRQLKEFNSYIELKKNLPSSIELINVSAIIVLPGGKLPALTNISQKTKLVLCSGPKTVSSSSLDHPLYSVLRWDKTSRFSDAINFLGHVLTNSTDLMILDNQVDEHIVEETFTSKDFFRMLAFSVSSLTIVRNVPDDFSLRMVATSSPAYIIEIPPLFIFPGLLGEKCRYLTQAISKLMMPVYVINIGITDRDLKDISLAVAKRMCEVLPNGPYNVLGVSTGGIFALETAKCLEEIVESSKVQLFLVDAVPATLQHLINEAQTSSVTDLDGIILQNFLHQPKITSEVCNTEKSWERRLNILLQQIDITNDDKKRITQTFNTVRYRLNQVLNYTPNDRLLNASTSLFRPHESSKDFSNTLTNICKQLNVEVVKGNHFTMLQSESLVNYINDNCITGPTFSQY